MVGKTWRETAKPGEAFAGKVKDGKRSGSLRGGQHEAARGSEKQRRFKQSQRRRTKNQVKTSESQRLFARDDEILAKPAVFPKKKREKSPDASSKVSEP